ncbi:putative endonuclease [Malonomonas rubra DSM 5091]|uniref:UPF0102 protein SAMN02745165_00967 n=1 Tax=Malonomonas rubra DSM 5091 TaxID=1122189 RepID=A0A1M6E787_MALRU|nr:YraN family protein [Malonomonas rubra]SHI81295.1 putative endonuclease [Malonomonas rubra DSM 5091]
MTQQRLALGKWGEEHAVAFLLEQGCKILARNYRTPVGEIDIVASKRKELLFVEVKTRRGCSFGLPQEAVGARKQQQIIRTAQWYLQQEKTAKLQPRFDVIAILCQSDQIAEIQHFPNAFGLS